MKSPKEPSLSGLVTEEDIRFYVQQFKKSGFRYVEWCPGHGRGPVCTRLLCSECRTGPILPIPPPAPAAPADLPPGWEAHHRL